jgi:hypothetical protein
MSPSLQLTLSFCSVRPLETLAKGFVGLGGETLRHDDALCVGARIDAHSPLPPQGVPEWQCELHLAQLDVGGGVR